MLLVNVKKSTTTDYREESKEEGCSVPGGIATD
jgi:hypothetical protein